MDNFNYQAYLKSGKIYGDKQEVISESKEVTERKKQGYDDREDESLGARRGAEKGKKQSFKDRRDDSYGKFGKRDAEAKGKAKGPGKNKVNKENVEEGRYGKEGAKKVCGAIRAAYGEGLVKEDARTDAEQEGYKDGFEDAKDDIEAELKKMKVSELKSKIKEDIIEFLSEQEEDVDVDVDIEDEAEVDVDAEGDNINIKKTGVKADVEVGLSPIEELVQDSLQAAMKASEGLGDEVLTDQIGNTITYFTRKFVVGNRTD